MITPLESISNRSEADPRADAKFSNYRRRNVFTKVPNLKAS
jgi:hypothetical protein